MDVSMLPLHIGKDDGRRLWPYLYTLIRREDNRLLHVPKNTPLLSIQQGQLNGEESWPVVITNVKMTMGMIDIPVLLDWGMNNSLRYGEKE